MRVLLDECLPRRLAASLVGHEVRTVVACGWSGVKNGALLRLAAAEFDVFLTIDGNLQYQQNLVQLPIAVVAIAAVDNRLQTLQVHVPALLARLAQLRSREFASVGDPKES